jgi:3-isopropylmalate/(R)-2-methylmalate dehydratase small subunit
MKKFTKHTGKTVAIYQANIDTDQIIPKQFLKSIERAGFGEFLFYDWRFNPDGTLNSEFVLNDPKYKDASILIAGANFGCGSSREHAPWSLEDFGFRVIIAPSFADIFYNNCFKTGVLPVTLPEEIIIELAEKSENQNNFQLSVDLENQSISDDGKLKIRFEINEFRRYCLLKGLDEIGLTLQNEAEISEYEKNRPPFLQIS